MFRTFNRPGYQVSVYRTIGPLVYVASCENLSSGFPTRFDTKRAEQPMKITRELKF